MSKQSVFKQSLLALGLAALALPVMADEVPTPSSIKTMGSLRICADPGNMPITSDKGEGFSNKIATIIAEGMGTHTSYFYRPYLERGLTRQTFDNNECDILMDMTADDNRMMTTIPIYRSTFVLAYRNDKGINIKSLDDPKLLNDYKVGVFQHSAIRTVLQEHGINRNNTIVRTIAHDADLRPERQPHMDVQLMIDGKLDVAALWGPMAGWYKTMKKAPIEIVPLNMMEDRTPMEFSLAIGMRKNAHDLKAAIEAVMLKEKDKIKKVLDEYGVPLVKCDDCVVSGNLPTHGAYKPIVRKAIIPVQSDIAALPAMVDEALKQGSSLDEELINASIARDATRIEYLLKRGAKIDTQDIEGKTSLMIAVQSNDLVVMNGLLEYKADPNKQDHDGWTAAMYAVKSNEPKLFRLMGKFKADYNLVNKDGMTALAMAVADNKANAAVAMLDNNANPDFAMGAGKYNALMLAVTKGNQTLAQTLLQYKANPNAKNAGGVTPLMIAAHKDQDMIVSLLLKAGAKASMKDDEGKTALQIAKENDAQKAIVMLEKPME
ncbi:quinoprotein dehydrogenase-associated putative ABC transporter substrate-binding protein [Methylotenera sp.]|uniref:quinoprotein dehydrogenase-associated putative ABC transporter substrate-binding protein n=2 Tax=Methylotenera sp. TaxID=2051956 RepID=UPI00273197E9|nr:quinoprotein dehydrogenase-associated putative ABC transporter substrate-binding protein [Methylotenera sp.]MDP2072501.1 quinoprotein dehydrogenase-associated putative ABC transporter substrate-binding protein [Methylotenera sp.]MDP2229532.1 quinoprotein dehydrogenase-associated putative ABC transporter substrate-binding protein [Methylotenera sp.]MDP3140924.1 quinoprotein dehydrogenase-associated putative ABC transporter substrate-binding protein [Methylotenera sp.]